MPKPPGSGILSEYRVVDLSTGIAGGYASKLLADAGADVIKIESAGGDPLRRWRTDGRVPADEDGALFRFLHTNKRAIVGELTDGFVRELLYDADLAIESFEPGVIDALDLFAIVPGIVVLSISPWGRGPWQHRPATEFTLQAECGALGRRGNPERPPVQCGGRLGEWITGVAAALGGLAAMTAARRSGKGDHVDVASFDTMMLTTNGYAHLLGSFTGTTDSALARSIEVPSIEPTADGYVGFCTVAAQQFQDFLVLIGADDWLGDPSFANRDSRWRRREEFNERVQAYTTTRTAEMVMEEAAAFRIPVAPIGKGATVPDLEACRGRESFVRNPSGGFLQPNVPYRLHGVSSEPLRPAPRLGGSGPVALRSRPPSGEHAPRLAPLEGVRVVDLTAWWAGPFASHQLAMLGADIIKVESIQRPDGMRFSSARGPADAARWWEWSSIFHSVNTNKRAITADLRRPEGVEIARRLIERADVVIENFTPRVLENFGLGWDAIAEINPRVILTRMPAFGLSGEWRDRPGFAQTMEQASGMAYITGYPDEAMQIPRGPCDPLAGLHAAFATLVALEERERSGIGRLVEVAMFEAALNASAEQIVEYSAYGNTLERAGNRGPAAAPQGIYRCQGDDQWVALSVETDAQWSSLQRVLSAPLVTRRADLESAEGRRAAHDTIDEAIDAWAATRTVRQCVDALVDVGVPAAAVAVDRSLGSHPSLVGRGYFEIIDHPVTASHAMATVPFRFLRRDQRWITRPAPVLGEHNVEVLHELGYTDREISALRANKVIGELPSNL